MSSIKLIRRGVAETNSSSTHSIVLDNSSTAVFLDKNNPEVCEFVKNNILVIPCNTSSTNRFINRVIYCIKSIIMNEYYNTNYYDVLQLDDKSFEVTLSLIDDILLSPLSSALNIRVVLNKRMWKNRFVKNGIDIYEATYDISVPSQAELSLFKNDTTSMLIFILSDYSGKCVLDDCDFYSSFISEIFKKEKNIIIEQLFKENKAYVVDDSIIYNQVKNNILLFEIYITFTKIPEELKDIKKKYKIPFLAENRWWFDPDGNSEERDLIMDNIINILSKTIEDEEDLEVNSELISLTDVFELVSYDSKNGELVWRYKENTSLLVKSTFEVFNNALGRIRFL